MGRQASEWALFEPTGRRKFLCGFCMWACDKVHVSLSRMCPADDSAHLSRSAPTDAAGVYQHSVFSTFSLLSTATQLAQYSTGSTENKAKCVKESGAHCVCY